MNDDAAIACWLGRFVEESLVDAEVDAFVRTVDDEILRSIPEVAADPALTEDLHASTRAHWRSFLVTLSSEHRLALPNEAIGLSSSIARRGMDINVLLKVYRVAHRGVFQHLTAHTAADRLPDGVARDEVLILLWTRAERWIDESVEALIESFARERDQLREGARARRAELIESLLAGTPPPADAAEILGHRLSLWQTGFVLWGSDVEQSPPLSEMAAQACRRLGLPTPVTKLAGSRELWGWIGTAQQPTFDVAPVEELLASRGLRVALGRPRRGADGFRLSHLQALAAQRLGLRADGVLFDYADLELLCQIGDSELVREMVRHEIGPLLGPQKNLAAIRETILVFLRSGRDVDATAAALYVHPNTVRYRLTRAGEMLGDLVTNRTAVLEVCLAWVDLHGVEPPPAD
jgi:DNA-binding PucR family transcriptional regulator